jgi:hypothetical protein
MKVIKKRSFVIETKLPIKFHNKTVIDDNLGEITVPDPERPTEYQYNWFAGVGAHPEIYAETGKVVPMNVWTPYPSQAAKYSSEDEAKAVYQIILGNDSGSWVVEFEKSHHKEGLQIVIPVTAAEGAAIMGVQSVAGMDGKKIK